ncbi:MAG: DUF2341 domain-containing protein [Candidatus Thorarchaeota archaeon]
MRRNSRFSKKYMLFLSVAFVTIILGMQLVAATAWTADIANSGPGLTIVQLSQDRDSEWATNDLVDRLSGFIRDDPFIPNRITVIKTSDPHVVESITDSIVIYVSHGGPLGIVTGKRLTTWTTMAEIVDSSFPSLHLFAACSSKNIIKHGSSDSDKQLYTVPGARPAEVTNVEIVTTVMLAFGFDPEEVDRYRTSELTKAKYLVQSGKSVHMMDFEQIILNEIDNIENSYNSTWTDDFRVYREAVEQTYKHTGNYTLLPYNLKKEIERYYWYFVDSTGVDSLRYLGELKIFYTMNYYINSSYVVEEGESMSVDSLEFTTSADDMFSAYYIAALSGTEGQWVNTTPVFTGGSYSGWIKFAPVEWQLPVRVNVTASGVTLAANGTTPVDSIALSEFGAGGTYVQRQQIDGIWQEPIVGRNAGRTGGLWTDPCVNADYEYNSEWTPLFGYISSSGEIHSNGNYTYVDSIPTGILWHGPSFVNTLPSYFTMADLGSFSTNFTINHDSGIVSQTCVSLYDANMKVALVVRMCDLWPSYQKSVFYASYYLENGTDSTLASEEFSGDTSGVVQIRYDPHQGVYGDVPRADEERLFKWTDINPERLIKYIVIQSYRYNSWSMNDARINNIRLSYAGSDFTVFHDSCNDLDDFHNDPDFGYGNVADGTFTVPNGESYITLSEVGPAEGWSYRKSHLLNGFEGAGYNYQIKIIAHYGTGTDSGQDVFLNYHSKSDFGDVRFIASGGHSFLDYWCESVDAGNKAVFWVKISANLNYDQMFYIYYGNSAAVSMSNGEKTFLFFDDFSGSSLNTSKWTIEKGAVEVSDGLMHVDGESISANKAYFHTTEGWGVGIQQHVRAIVNTPTPNAMRCASFIDTDYGWNDFIDGQFYGDTNYFRSRVANDYPENASSSFVYTPLSQITNWHVYSTYWIPGQVGFRQDDSLFWMHPFAPWSAPMNIPDGDEDLSMFFSEAGTSGHDMDVDWVFVRKCANSEHLVHSDWGEEVFYDGWHGPNYVRVLDRPFRLCQLSEFSVIGELIQSSNTMGQTHVALFDENKDIVLLVYWGDSWKSSTQGYFRVYFYPQDGGTFTLGSGYISTSFKKTGSMWWCSYPGGNGSIYGNIDGDWELLGRCDNASRVIKYAVLLSNIYPDCSPVDMRIHDINIVADLKWNQRAVVLNDPCNDMDNFESDPDFGWGTISAGEVYVPTNQSYMTCRDIPSTPASWHGLNYVHELETPFILNALRFFSIQAELFHESSDMGFLSVALFDVNHEIVMNIYLKDAWGSSNKGVSHVTYYPEDGSPVSDTTGDITGDFYRMNELSVVDGRVKYEISDYGGQIQAGDLGPVANPYRQVKYLVIRFSRYSSYTMDDLQLQTIGLYAGLVTTLPDPVIADGTSFGEPQPPPQEDWITQVINWWTGPWPECHSKVDQFYPNGGHAMVQTKTDLFGRMNMEMLSIGDGQGNNLDELDETVGDLSIQLLLDNLVVLGGLLILEFIFASVSFAANFNPLWTPVAVAEGFVWLLLYIYSITILEVNLRNSGYPPLLRFQVLIATGLLFGFGALLLGIGYKVFGAILAGENVGEVISESILGSFIFLIFKLCAAAALFAFAFYTLTIP